MEESQLSAAFDFSLDESEEMEPGKWIPCPSTWTGESLPDPIKAIVNDSNSPVIDPISDTNYPLLPYVDQISTLEY